MTSPHRARYLRVAGVLLSLSGVGAVLCGVGAWMVSGCCGSPSPPEDGYLLVGAVAGCGFWASAHWCFSRSKRQKS